MPDHSTYPGLTSYRLLGRSGLRVSPLCLGTMTFGTEWGWGADEQTNRDIMDHYLDAGGNFFDTADRYTGGTSEEMIGRYLAERGKRHEVVVATKFTFSHNPADPNSGGNGRKHIMDAVEGSLRRLQTDYIDLYWLHCWDLVTPVEEVMQTLDRLVTAGKIRYIGLSDTPAWYLSRAQTLAEWHGWAKVAALQLEYSLVERNIELEHVPAALELGMGITPWSPLASGLLTGKYSRTEKPEDSRLKVTEESPNPVFHKLIDRNFDITDVVLAVAKELGHSPAQVALNWVTNRPGITSTIIGARKLSQLEDNLGALSFSLPIEMEAKLNAVSEPARPFPWMFFTPPIQGAIHGDHGVPSRP